MVSNEEKKMMKQEFYTKYYDIYEYHGSTVIERTRKKAGRTIKRDWILFDSVEKAQEFFNENCGEFRGFYVP